MTLTFEVDLDGEVGSTVGYR